MLRRLSPYQLARVADASRFVCSVVAVGLALGAVAVWLVALTPDRGNRTPARDNQAMTRLIDGFSVRR